MTTAREHHHRTREARIDQAAELLDTAMRLRMERDDANVRADRERNRADLLALNLNDARQSRRVKVWPWDENPVFFLFLLAASCTGVGMWTVWFFDALLAVTG